MLFEGPSNPAEGHAGELRRRLLHEWFQKRSRVFPWRKYTSRWQVLLAEMLLLRTRADIVVKHIDTIVCRFPTPASLAIQDMRTVEEALRPLGLRWRAHRIHQLSQVIVSNYGGQVPLELDKLLDLPGVGPYVASATLANLTDQHVLLTDTNTVRVATRVAGIAARGDIRRRREVQSAIAALLGGPTGADDWLAVLDLAATVCLPRNPRCADCPIAALCARGIETLRVDGHRVLPG
jgi:A/G-specific adenine glycosylase